MDTIEEEEELLPESTTDIESLPTPGPTGIFTGFLARTRNDCLATNTEHCKIDPRSDSCIDSRFYSVYCSADALNIEIQYFLTKIQRLNVTQSLLVSITGTRTFSQDTFAPVADDLAYLSISDYSDFKLSDLRTLKLPQLLLIYLINCSNIVIKEDDYYSLPNNVVIFIENSTVKTIEKIPSSLPLQRIKFF